MLSCFVFFFKQKTAYEMRISDWSSDVCSSDLLAQRLQVVAAFERRHEPSLRMAPGQPAQFAGEPGVVVGVELQLRQRVAPVRVEAGGDQQQLWPEGVDRRQQAVFPGCPEAARSEEHTSELQSLMRISYSVFCLKKNNIKHFTP